MFVVFVSDQDRRLMLEKFSRIVAGMMISVGFLEFTRRKEIFRKSARRRLSWVVWS